MLLPLARSSWPNDRPTSWTHRRPARDGRRAGCSARLTSTSAAGPLGHEPQERAQLCHALGRGRQVVAQAAGVHEVRAPLPARDRDVQAVDGEQEVDAPWHVDRARRGHRDDCDCCLSALESVDRAHRRGTEAGSSQAILHERDLRVIGSDHDHIARLQPPPSLAVVPLALDEVAHDADHRIRLLR